MTTVKRGLVIDVDLKKVVVLTPSGEFLAVKLARGESIPRIGEEYSLQAQSELQFNYNRFLRYAALVAVLLIIVLLPFAQEGAVNSYIPLTQMDSYLVIDINPSIELGLDKNQYVRAAKALNEDGEQVLQNVNVLGEPLKTVIKQIIDTSIELGYLKQEAESQNIIFTYVPSKTEVSENISEKEIVEEVNISLGEKSIIANVETIVTSTDVRKEADKLGLSTGKYIVYREAIASGLSVTPEELRAESLEKAITKSGGDLKQLLKQVKKEQVAQKLEKKISNEFNAAKLEKELKKEISDRLKEKNQDNLKIKFEKENVNSDNKHNKENQKNRNFEQNEFLNRIINTKNDKKDKAQEIKNDSINLKSDKQTEKTEKNDNRKLNTNKKEKEKNKVNKRPKNNKKPKKFIINIKNKDNNQNNNKRVK